jgi:hypothetical protein
MWLLARSPVAMLERTGFAGHTTPVVMAITFLMSELSP